MDRHALLLAQGRDFARAVFDLALAYRVEVDDLVAALLCRSAPSPALHAARALIAAYPAAADALAGWPAVALAAVA